MPGHAPYPDRYSVAARQRQRQCRKCGRWWAIADYPRYRDQYGEWRRRRVCQECRNEQNRPAAKRWRLAFLAKSAPELA